MFKEIGSNLDPPRFLWGPSRATRLEERYHSCWWSRRKGLARQGHHLHPWRKHWHTWHTYLGCKTAGNAGNANIYQSFLITVFSTTIESKVTLSCFLKCETPQRSSKYGFPMISPTNWMQTAIWPVPSIPRHSKHPVAHTQRTLTKLHLRFEVGTSSAAANRWRGCLPKKSIAGRRKSWEIRGLGRFSEVMGPWGCP